MQSRPAAEFLFAVEQLLDISHVAAPGTLFHGVMLDRTDIVNGCRSSTGARINVVGLKDCALMRGGTEGESGGD